jgi:hypothetical protein
MRKIIVIILVFSIINIFGCYYQEQMSPGDYNYNDHYDILLTTRDTTYKLKGEEYQFYNDTLTVNLSKQIDNQTKLKYDVKIPADEINIVEVEMTDTLGTAGVILGVLAGLFAAMVIVAAASYGN